MSIHAAQSQAFIHPGRGILRVQFDRFVEAIQCNFIGPIFDEFTALLLPVIRVVLLSGSIYDDRSEDQYNENIFGSYIDSSILIAIMSRNMFSR